ncbi:hypothetical protein [Streptomyces diastatochromogenes]
MRPGLVRQSAAARTLWSPLFDAVVMALAADTEGAYKRMGARHANLE